MPVVLSKNVTQGTQLFLWQIEESLSDLVSIARLTTHEAAILDNFKNETRKLEWTSVRALLNIIFEKKVIVRYAANGKPEIEECAYVSFSHTQGFVAVALSDKHCVGVDVECVSDRVLRIKERFLNQMELLSLKQETEWLQVLVYWCLKEVLFKIAPGGNIDFRKDMTLNMLDVKTEQEIIGSVQVENDIINARLNYIEYNNVVVAWGAQIN